MIQTVGSIFVVLLLMVVGWRLPSTKGRQLLFLAASYLFYASWGIGFLVHLNHQFADELYLRLGTAP